MKRTKAQAAEIAAWWEMFDHCENRLHQLGALNARARGRVLQLKSELREAREQVETLTYNLKTFLESDKKRRGARILRARASRDTIDGLRREVSRLSDELDVMSKRAKRADTAAQHSEERRLELLALASELGCDCVPHLMLDAVRKLKATQ